MGDVIDLVRAQDADAAKWARAYIEMFPNGCADEETMLGWFANAIMTGLDRAATDRRAANLVILPRAVVIKAVEAMEAWQGHMRKMQALGVEVLEGPPRGLSEHAFTNCMLRYIDGPEERAVDALTRTARAALMEAMRDE